MTLERNFNSTLQPKTDEGGSRMIDDDWKAPFSKFKCPNVEAETSWVSERLERGCALLLGANKLSCALVAFWDCCL
jgi:hypothetical protein